MIEKFILPVREKIGIPDLDRTYYSIRFDQYKIVLIVLDCYDVPDTTDSAGNFLIPRGVDAMSQEQIEWFVDTLQEIPTDYHLIVASHDHFGNAVPVDGIFTQPGATVGNCSFAYLPNKNIIADIIQAWIEGTAIEKTYSPVSYLAAVTDMYVNADFSKRGEGIFICHLTGHQHRDAISRDASHPNQLTMCFAATCADLWQNYISDLPRTIGTKSEDCITVFSVDTENRAIKLVRVGSNITMAMTERTMIAIPY